MSDDINPNNAKGNIGYHMTLMAGIIDLFHEAAQEGLLHQAEDLVDILWAMIPSPDKKKFKVLDEDHVKSIGAFEAWEQANKLRPPCEIGEEYERNNRTVQMSESDYSRHRSNRIRITRKAQIWTDVVYQLGFLYKRIASGITVPDPNDNEWAESDLNDEPDDCTGTGLSEGLAGTEDTQALED